jgi:hypothetical protein
METLMFILGIITAAAIGFEFLLGPSGRAKVKDRLSTWWIYFDDMRLSEFATSEAATCVSLSDRLFGSTFWSWRRLLSCLVIELGLLIFWLTLAYLAYPSVLIAIVNYPRVDMLFDITTNLVLMMAAVSLTRWMSARALAYAFGRRAGILPFAALLGVHILLFIAWRPTSDYLHDVLTDVVLHLLFAAAKGHASFQHLWFAGIDSSAHLIGFHWQRALSWPAPDLRFNEFRGMLTPDGSVFLTLVAVRQSTSILFSSLRIAFALGVLLTFLFRRFAVRVISLTWRRIVEDPRGPFTLIVSGATAVVVVVKGILDRI